MFRLETIPKKEPDKTYETQHKNYNKHDSAISYIFNTITTQTPFYTQEKNPDSAAVFTYLQLSRFQDSN